MKYRTIEHDVCHLCRDFCLTGKRSARYNKRELSWLDEIALEVGDSQWQAGGEVKEDYCTVCQVEEHDLQLTHMTCHVADVPDVLLEDVGS